MTQLNPRRKQTEVTPGNAFHLGLPFVLANQSLFTFWVVHSGDFFIEMEGDLHGWDNATVRVSETGPGVGPPIHTRSRRSSCSLTARWRSPLSARCWT
ncbi:MAG TPA: hypothetical protein VMD59_00020 [Acidimicrobiales bacterium]|nr:hypothetical protein [Acidimicrobiales bacterium]